MPINGIMLVPFDFQEPSFVALRLAQELGTKLDREVVLLHVYTVPVVVYPGVDPILMPALADEGGANAKEALQALGAKIGARTILRSGDPAREILATIRETNPAMVVMGTQGRRGLAHVLLGSVAEQVVRLSTVPVLTVHAPEELADSGPSARTATA